MEGIWNTGPSQPLLLFAVPDQKAQKNLYEIAIPNGASLINTHSLHGVMLGLKSVPPKDQPIVASVFYGFRIMVGIGFLFLGMAIIGTWLWAREKLFTNKFYLRLLVLIAPLGFFATIFGWITAESGRQPWVVYGLMRTVDGASVVPLSQVMISLTLFLVVYGVIFTFYLYYLFKVIRRGPVENETLDKPRPSDEEEKHLFQYMT
jgi:cytochrome bd ubiquinol oxidase subunit I